MIAPRAPASPGLAALVREAAPDAPRFEAAAGARLKTAGDKLGSVSVIERGLVSMLATAQDGGQAETALLGPGALIGHTALLGARKARLDALALTAVSGLVLKVNDLSRAAETSQPLRSALTAHLRERIEETERLCACAALHPVERRLADWLRRAASMTDSGPLQIIHERLATVLGVRRASVTVALHMLEGELAIRCARGRIEIRDGKLLGELACGCRG